MKTKSARHSRKQLREARALKIGSPVDAIEEDPISLKPDGYYWIGQNGNLEVGPFESYELAAADLHAGEESLAPTETLPEIEAEIGISAWIDPETGEPAQGHSPPHLTER